jgi:hypothetical protein
LVTHAATLDVTRHIVVHLTRLLGAHCRRLVTPWGSRALGTFRQAVPASAATSSSRPAPDGTPLWVSDVEPASTPDITAARLHVLPASYKAAADDLPTLADTGYIGIRVPVRRRLPLHPRGRGPPGVAGSHASTDPQKRAADKTFVILDGTLLSIDRIAAARPFYSGKHRKHGMNLQVIADPHGRLLWASPALPGAVHGIKAA